MTDNENNQNNENTANNTTDLSNISTPENTTPVSTDGSASPTSEPTVPVTGETVAPTTGDTAAPETAEQPVENKTITVTFDGTVKETVTVDAGSTLTQAAQKANITVSHHSFRNADGKAMQGPNKLNKDVRINVVKKTSMG